MRSMSLRSRKKLPFSALNLSYRSITIRFYLDLSMILRLGIYGRVRDIESFSFTYFISFYTTYGLLAIIVTCSH